jgi:hypothetical protein
VNRLAARRALFALRNRRLDQETVTSPEHLPAVRRYTEAWVNLLKDITAKHGSQCAEISNDLSLFLEGFSKQFELFRTGSGPCYIFNTQMDRYLLEHIPQIENHGLEILVWGHEGAKPVLEGRRFAVTEGGALATVPGHAQPGDICVSFFGNEQSVCRHVPADKSSRTQEELLERKEAAVLEAARKVWLSERGYKGPWSRVSTPVTVSAHVRLVGQCIAGENTWDLINFPLNVYALE